MRLLNEGKENGHKDASWGRSRGKTVPQGWRKPGRAHVRSPYTKSSSASLPAAFDTKCSFIFANIFMLCKLQRKIDMNKVQHWVELFHPLEHFGPSEKWRFSSFIHLTGQIKPVKCIKEKGSAWLKYHFPASLVTSPALIAQLPGA